MTRKVERTGTTKGFTLIELAVVLAIIAVLAAVMTPIITNYVDQSRIARAQADVITIAEAIKAYNRDTAQYPIYASFTTMLNDDIGTLSCLVGPGSSPVQASGITDWACGSNTGDFEAFLNTNKLGSTGDSSAGITTSAALGKVAYRGPYVGSVDSDPWGNKYLASAANMKRSSINWAFVISAGPNQKVDTKMINQSTGNTSGGTATTAFRPSGDDIIAVIK